MKIGYITNSPAPYRIQQINKFHDIENVNITLYYTNSKRGSRNWNINHKSIGKEVILSQFYLFRYKDYDFFLNGGLRKIVKDNDLIIIGGYEQFSYFLIAQLCKLYRKKYILLFDGIQPQKIGTKTNFFKDFIIKSIVKGAQSIFGNGLVSKLYFSQNYHYDENHIYNQYLTVDIEQIDKISSCRKDVKKRYKEKYNIKEGQTVIVSVSRLLDWKNTQLLLKSVSLLNRPDSVVVFIVGDGPERANLEKMAHELNLNVVFTGNIAEPLEVYNYYLLADLFVFPTRHEAWGLVVNEAMAAGLPILCSKGAGASLDLVQEGINGYTFSPDDPMALKDKIQHLIDDERLRTAFGTESKRIIREWTFESSKESFENLLVSEGFIKENRRS